MARRYYSSTAARTTLASGVDNSTTTLSVTAVAGWPSSYPYTLVIDQDTVNEELVEVSARSGTTLTVTRGVDGTSAVAHDAGAAVNHGVSARDFDEPNAFINGTGVVTETLLASNSVSAVKIVDGTITDSKIGASAAIAQSKIDGLTSDLASKPTFTYGTATPTADADGAIWYDENDTPPTPKFWDGSAWQPFSSGIGAAAISSPAATGQYTDSGITYDYYVFNSTSTLTVDDAGDGIGGFADILVVGAGGGGGAGGVAGGFDGGGNGGGAGGYLAVTDAYLEAGTLTVVVGAGGAGGVQPSNTLNSNGKSGTTSRVASYYGVGGGGGGGANSQVVGVAGGSGGASWSASTGQGLSGQGNNGGQGSAGAGAGGGGGGASAVGGSYVGSSQGAVGGAGSASDITGSSVTRGGGGGGAGYRTAAGGAGGSGGGGAGGSGAAGTAGTANTGGGGGAGGNTASVGYNGAAGGSGVVIVRVKV